jgi:hypothetical protein
MARAVLELVLIFLSPFIVYGLYRFFRKDEAEETDAARLRPYAVLALIGLVLAGGSLAAGRLLVERKTGPYQPAVVKDGVVQPGQVK